MFVRWRNRLLLFVFVGFQACLLASAHNDFVLELTNDTFDRVVGTTLCEYVVVEFFAPWCGHCRRFNPVYQKVAATYFGSKILIAKVDSTKADANILLYRFKIQSFPTLLLFPGGNTTVLAKTGGYQLFEEVVEWIQQTTRIQQQIEANLSKDSIFENDDKLALRPAHLIEVKKEQLQLQRKARLKLLATTVYFAFRFSIFVGRGRPMTADEELALTNFLTTLEMRFPSSSGRASFTKLKKLLLDLKIQGIYDVIATKHLMSRWEIASFPWMKEFHFRNDPLKLDWGQGLCQGTTAHLRGYTCGLWHLFHTLLANSHHSDTGSIHLRAIIGFVAHFFDCGTCREHFANMTARIKWPSIGVDTDRWATLWLWRVHNSVNERLKGDITEDPVAPKIQWPSPSLCLRCRNPEHELSSVSWNEDLVYQFLLLHYGCVDMDTCPTLYAEIGNKKGTLGSVMFIVGLIIFVAIEYTGCRKKSFPKKSYKWQQCILVSSLLFVLGGLALLLWSTQD